MGLDSEVKSLQQVPLFQGVDPVRLKLLAFASERLSFRDGDVLFRQGDASDAAYVLLSGTAAVEIDTPKGRLRVADVGANSCIGEMGIICEAPRSATILASGSLTALKIRRDVFFDLLNEHPPMAIAVMRDLARRLERTNALLARSQ